MASHVYSDINRELKTNASGTYKVEYDTHSIFQSIRLILSTVPGELVRSPIGCVLYGLLFEPMSRDAEIAIANAIFDAIDRYEPRVRITNVRVDADYDNHTYDVSIDFHIKKLTTKLKFETKLRSMGTF